MSERGIIFSAPMVRALLAGRKTQTRRIVKWELGARNEGKLVRMRGSRSSLYLDDTIGLAWSPAGGDPIQPWPADRIGEASPYGAIGSRLWVREAIEFVSRKPPRDAAIFSADGEVTVLDTWPWKVTKLSPIYMPRGLSRITLEITSVRVQRLKELTEDDAIAEGAQRFANIPDPNPYGNGARWSMDEPASTDDCLGTARFAFASKWNTINGKDSWDANPWVWALTFTAEVASG